MVLFIDAYLYSLIFIIFALVFELLFGECIISLFSLNIISEILGLSISNSLGVLCLKLYFSSNGFHLGILSG